MFSTRPLSEGLQYAKTLKYFKQLESTKPFQKASYRLLDFATIPKHGQLGLYSVSTGNMNIISGPPK